MHIERRRCRCGATYRPGDRITAIPTTIRSTLTGIVHSIDDDYTVVIDTGSLLVAVDVEDCLPRPHHTTHCTSLLDPVGLPTDIGKPVERRPAAHAQPELVMPTEQNLGACRFSRHFLGR